jgi:hypothetical protein
VPGALIALIGQGDQAGGGQLALDAQIHATLLS